VKISARGSGSSTSMPKKPRAIARTDCREFGVVVGGRQVGRLECRRESDRAQAPTDTRERGEIDAARPRPFAEESRKVGSERAGRNEALRYE
jgi:hypothetical protein